MEHRRDRGAPDLPSPSSCSSTGPMGAASEVGWQRRRRRGRGWEEEGDVGGWEVGGPVGVGGIKNVSGGP
jgi:hypothetical protein